MLEKMVATKTEGAHIGHLFWYSMGEDLYGRDTLEKALNDNGLSTGFMPNKIRLVDAFRRASKEVETKKNLGNGLYENYIVRDVYSDSGVTVRHIVKERVDSQGKRLSYDPGAARLILSRKEDDIEVTGTDDTAIELGNEAARKYNVFKSHHNGAAVRCMVQGILKTLSPTPVRPSGGIYFVPSAHDEGLRKLKNFCSTFTRGEGFKIPVVENEESLEMVATKVGEHLEGILGQCRTAINDGTLTKGKLAELINEAKSVVTGYRDYEKILVDQKEEMENRIQLVKESMLLLFDKAS